MEKIPMTEEGQKKLLEELKHLKTVERPIIIKGYCRCSKQWGFV